VATRPKIVTLHRPQDILSPELREFLDTVVVPALLKKYVTELEEEKPAEKMLAPANRPAAYSLASRSPRSARGGFIE
jgi:hypothetical protein